MILIGMAAWALVSSRLAEVRAAADTPSISLPPDAGPMATSRAAELKAADYVERELFLEGSAASYSSRDDWTSDGFWTAAVPGARAPYKVRMLVRYPVQPARFNGLVFVEWLNVSGQTEADPNFSLLHVELIRSGYAYVGVGAQAVGVNGTSGLKKINGARYGSLQHPGDSYSYDIYSQAGQAIRTPKGPAPLGPLTSRISRLIAAGESQSASRMVTYVNAVHPLVNVYDGFFIHSRGGGPAPLAQDAQNKPTVPLPALSRIRRDLRTPVFQVQAETDVPNFVAARQLDDDAVHTWELAGTAHADRYLLTGGGTRPLAMTCTDSETKLNVPVNDGPMTYSLRAALRHLRRWIETGTPPPTGRELSVEGRQIKRDPATGLALGGVRTPHVDVPVRTLSGVREPAGGGGFCRLFGRTDEWNGNTDAWDGTPADPSPTPEPVLSTLYGSPSVYRARFDEALERAITNGFLLGEDVAAIRAEAAAVHWEEPRAR